MWTLFPSIGTQTIWIGKQQLLLDSWKTITYTEWLLLKPQIIKHKQFWLMVRLEKQCDVHVYSIASLKVIMGVQKTGSSQT